MDSIKVRSVKSLLNTTTLAVFLILAFPFLGQSQEKKTYYTLQIASYPNEELAKARLSKLPYKDQAVFYRAANVKGKTWYRLYVGRFETEKDAFTFQKLFNEQIGDKKSFVRLVSMP